MRFYYEINGFFSGINHHGDEDLDTLPPIIENSTETDLLDYMVLVLSRYMSCSTAFKGGYTSTQLIPDFSRATHDINFSISHTKDYEVVKKVLKSICEKFKQSGYISKYRIKETATVQRGGGVDMYDSSGRKILGVDVGIHDISFGITHYNLTFTDIDGFNVERILADKLAAITTRARFRRTKDLYDFYVITNFFDIDLIKLGKYVRKRNNVEWDNIPFEAKVITQYKMAWDKLNIAMYDETSTFSKPEFDTVLGRFYKIALPLKMGTTLSLWEAKNGRCI